MEKNSRQFHKNLSIFTVIFFIPGLIFYLLAPEQYVSPVLLFIYPVFFLLTLLSFRIINKSLTIKFSRFVNIYMILTVAKLLIYLLIILLYSLVFRNDAVNFIISFFIIYLAYTFFEILAIIKLPQKSNQEPKK